MFQGIYCNHWICGACSSFSLLSSFSWFVGFVFVVNKSEMRPLAFFAYSEMTAFLKEYSLWMMCIPAGELQSRSRNECREDCFFLCYVEDGILEGCSNSYFSSLDGWFAPKMSHVSKMMNWIDINSLYLKKEETSTFPSVTCLYIGTTEHHWLNDHGNVGKKTSKVNYFNKMGRNKIRYCKSFHLSTWLLHMLFNGPQYIWDMGKRRIWNH